MRETKVSFDGLSDSQRSSELLKRRKSLFRHLTDNYPELQASKVDFNTWFHYKQELALTLTVEVHSEEAKTWILENVPQWDGMPVVPYHPRDLQEVKMVRHKARYLVNLLQNTDPVTRMQALDTIKKWTER